MLNCLQWQRVAKLQLAWLALLGCWFVMIESLVYVPPFYKCRQHIYLFVFALLISCIATFLLSFSRRQFLDLGRRCLLLPVLLHALKDNTGAIRPFFLFILLEGILRHTHATCVLWTILFQMLHQAPNMKAFHIGFVLFNDLACYFLAKTQRLTCARKQCQ